MYRVFSQGRFQYERASAVMFQESLKHVEAGEVYVVAGDTTQTPRNSSKMEGVSWLRNLRTPAFRPGIHLAQRWFNGCWMMPAEAGYSQAMPLKWLPAFTEKARRQVTPTRTEWGLLYSFSSGYDSSCRVEGECNNVFSCLATGTMTRLSCGDSYRNGSSCWHAVPKTVLCMIANPSDAPQSQIWTTCS